MPVKLDAVLERVAAADTTADRDQLRRTVLDTIAALGLYVAKSGEVYNPAEPEKPAYHDSLLQQNVRWSGGRRGR